MLQSFEQLVKKMTVSYNCEINNIVNTILDKINKKDYTEIGGTKIKIVMPPILNHHIPNILRKLEKELNISYQRINIQSEVLIMGVYKCIITIKVVLDYNDDFNELDMFDKC